MATRMHFEVSTRYRTLSYFLVGIGIVSLLIGFFLYGARGDDHQRARFWGSLLFNSIYFLLITNAAMFLICATTLAWAGWPMTFRRVTEAISAAVPVIGSIAAVILLAIVFTHQYGIYHWLDKEAVQRDSILKGKTGFLNPGFFAIWTLLAIGLWSILGYKMRQLSRQLDDNPLPDAEAGRRFIFKNTVWASLFIVWFALTVMSTVPWLWLMSIDPHWYSTMYSWYNFASTFVAGIALVTMFVIYLKNRGYLEYTNEEHLHDLGKFIFAFSIFWAYLWFSQYMLIWYANMPEETIYFKVRAKGVYSTWFWLMFLINFLVPLLFLMRRNPKRNYTSMTFLGALMLIGHWMDYHQMVFASVVPDHVVLNFFDIGIAAGFVGIILLVTGNVLAKYPLVAKNHPFIKESIIHHT